MRKLTYVGQWSRILRPVLIKTSLAIQIGMSLTLVQGTVPISSSTPQSSASDQKSQDTSKDQDQSTPVQKPKSQKKPKRGSLVIAPIPISSPAIGSGLNLIVGYVFKLDPEDSSSPPSQLGLAAIRTNNGTRGFAVGGRLYLKENTYQSAFAIAAGQVNMDFYGIGVRPNETSVIVPLSIKGKFVYGELLRNVGHSIFVGPRYQYRTLEAGQQSPTTPGGFEVPQVDIKAPSAAVGVHVQRDRRDSTFYPTKGSLFDFTGDFFDQAWGSRRQYQTYKIAYNEFRQLKPKQILAYRAMACSANQNVPFYDLCLYGYRSDIRGYTTGQFQDRRMFAAQAEYRLELPKRFGLVGFAGVGGVAERWSRFRADDLLPAGGVGLRFKLDKKNHINYRIDYAIGRAGPTLSIGVSEAF